MHRFAELLCKDVCCYSEHGKTKAPIWNAFLDDSVSLEESRSNPDSIHLAEVTNFLTRWMLTPEGSPRALMCHPLMLITFKCRLSGKWSIWEKASKCITTLFQNKAEIKWSLDIGCILLIMSDLMDKMSKMGSRMLAATWLHRMLLMSVYSPPRASLSHASTMHHCPFGWELMNASCSLGLSEVNLACRIRTGQEIANSGPQFNG